MFRDVLYITEDYSLRIQLGYVIFRWWRPIPDAKDSVFCFYHRVKFFSLKNSQIHKPIHCMHDGINTHGSIVFLAVGHSDTRLTVYLDSVELHVFNRSSEYAKLEKFFGLDEFMVPGSTKDDEASSDNAKLVALKCCQSTLIQHLIS